MKSPAFFSQLFGLILLSLLLTGSLFAQGHGPEFLFVANYIDGTISVSGCNLDRATLARYWIALFRRIRHTRMHSPGQQFLYSAGGAVTASV